MVFRRPIFGLTVVVLVWVLLGLRAPTQADVHTEDENAAINMQQQRSENNRALVDSVIRGAPSFTQLRLAPGVRSISYAPAWGEEGVFGTPDGTMYVFYQLPLPAGAAAGETMRDIGTLDMGKVHPLAKPAWGAWSHAGSSGETPIVADQKGNLFALHGENMVSVSPSFVYRPVLDEPSTCGTFADGSTCETGVAGSGVVVYAKSNAGRRRSIVTQAELDAALGGNADLHGTPPVGIFNFDGRDYLNFDGAIFAIRGWALSIEGFGTQLAYSKKHIVLLDWHDSGGFLNEEEVP